MERPAHWGREKKNCSGSSAIISYQPIQTTSPTALSVCVCVCTGAKQEREAAHERQRESATERERQSREGGGSIFFHLTPPSPSNHRKEGPDRKLPIKSARGSRHYLSNKLLTDYMSRSLVLDWRKPLFFFFNLVTFPLYSPPPTTNIRMTF